MRNIYSSAGDVACAVIFSESFDSFVTSPKSRLCEHSEAISWFVIDLKKRDCRPCLNQAGAGVAEFIPQCHAGLLAMTTLGDFLRVRQL
jgi:hypothetical protein